MDDRDFTAEEILNVKKDISDIIVKALQDAVKIGHTEPIMMMLCVRDNDGNSVPYILDMRYIQSIEMGECVLDVKKGEKVPAILYNYFCNGELRFKAEVFSDKKARYARYMEVTKSLYTRGIMLEPSKYGTLGAFWAKTNT